MDEAGPKVVLPDELVGRARSMVAMLREQAEEAERNRCIPVDSIEAMRSAGIPNHMTDRLMGHTIPGIAGRYGSPRALLAEARDAIEKAVEHLGHVDDAIYTDAERMK